MTTRTSRSVIRSTTRKRALPTLFARLYPALDALGTSYEVRLVKRRSPPDRSAALLSRSSGNAGPMRRASCCFFLTPTTASIPRSSPGFEPLAAAERVPSRLDADLQNRPRKIRSWLPRWTPGTTTSAACGATAEDSLRSGGRHRGNEPDCASASPTNPHDDQGCMAARLQPRDRNGHRGEPRDQHVHPALAYTFASQSDRGRRLRMAVRAAAEAHYPLYKADPLNFDLITGFSLVPLQNSSRCSALLVSAVALATYVRRHRLSPGLRASGKTQVRCSWGPRHPRLLPASACCLFGLGPHRRQYVGRHYHQVSGNAPLT